MYSDDDLTALKRIISTAGLIRAFDGADWIDLRKVMTEVINALLESRKKIEHLEIQKDELKAEVFRLSHPAYHD